MTTDVRTVLLDTGAITAEQASEIAQYVEPIDNPQGPEAGALFESRRPGKDATIFTAKPRNLVVNWKKLLIGGATVLAATLVAAGGPIGVLAAVGLCLTAVTALAPAAVIELSDDHAKVVQALWLSDATKDADTVPVEQLTKMLNKELSADRIDKILDELTLLQIIELGEHGEIIKRERLFSLSSQS
jgi:hypothetical protein